MQTSETIGKLAAALSRAQGMFAPAALNSKNPFLKNNYADFAAIVEATRDAMAANGLSFAQKVQTGYHFREAEGFGPPTVSVETILLHESGEWLSSGTAILPVFEEKGLSVSQVAGKVITYLRRYQLSALLGVRNEEDVDGNLPNQLGQRNERRQQASQTPPPPRPAPQAGTQAAQTPVHAAAQPGVAQIAANALAEASDKQTALAMWSAAHGAARKAGLNPPMLNRAWTVDEIARQARALEIQVEEATRPASNA